ncbi:EAL domain-containing response regulator [Shewanella marinintestina]|uniref:EAL domain-containing response regulator n=1 Tax=Shewanella marinintestina TaxID=190305 RepID=UPI00200BF77C|nr:EAL domain-containing response regulator [Shewanella marinintestina]MCL1145920.1 EAL domain-containing response regulator [Shewanella marinintestina]
MKILIVDDQMFIRSIIKQQLEEVVISNMIQIEEASSANAAIAFFNRTNHPASNKLDLIILDLKMKEGDGLTLISHMVAIKDLETPLIIISSTNTRALSLVKNIIKKHRLNLIGVFKKPLNVRNIYLEFLQQNKKQKTKKSYTSPPSLCNTENIRNLINHDNLLLCYQPKINITTQKIIGFEALSRLYIKGDKFISPKNFLPIVEQTKNNHRLTKLVLNQALSQWKSINELKNYNLAINISAHDLDSEDFVEYIIGKHNKNNDINLTLELTESQQTINKTATSQAIVKLIINGIKVSLDDFGKSYSSLERLDSIPFDEIKIDKDFVTDIDTNEQHHAIVTAIINMAKKLNVKVVAEGVETIAVVNKLTELNCQYAQGFYYSPPIEGRYLIEWINNYTKAIGG